MKMNLQSQVLMFLMERCIVSCRSKRLSSRLQHIRSNNSAIHGKDIKPKGTSSNRGSWINKALITGIKKKTFQGRNILSVPEGPFFLRIWLTGLWATAWVSFNPSSSSWSGQRTWAPTDQDSLATGQWLLGWVFVWANHLCSIPKGQSWCTSHPNPTSRTLDGGREDKRDSQCPKCIYKSLSHQRRENILLYHQRDLVFWKIKNFESSKRANPATFSFSIFFIKSLPLSGHIPNDQKREDISKQYL